MSRYSQSEGIHYKSKTLLSPFSYLSITHQTTTTTTTASNNNHQMDMEATQLDAEISQVENTQMDNSIPHLNDEDEEALLAAMDHCTPPPIAEVSSPTLTPPTTVDAFGFPTSTSTSSFSTSKANKRKIPFESKDTDSNKKKKITPTTSTAPIINTKTSKTTQKVVKSKEAVSPATLSPVTKKMMNSNSNSNYRRESSGSSTKERTKTLAKSSEEWSVVKESVDKLVEADMAKLKTILVEYHGHKVMNNIQRAIFGNKIDLENSVMEIT